MNMTTPTAQSNEPGNVNFVCQKPPPIARTANEAAAMVFPELAQHFNAFWEREASMHEDPAIELLDLNDDFWAHSVGLLGNPEHPIVFVPSENQFRLYNPQDGIYEPIPQSKVVSQILANLELCAEFLPPRVQIASFLALKNRQRLKSVVDRARDLLAVDDDYFDDGKPFQIPLLNGVLQLDPLKFHAHHPIRALRETLPVKYEPEAKCETFLDCFLRCILDPDDIDLLQRYLSQVLEGKNHTQKILVLTGDAGWGKSSLMKILGTLIGWNRVGIIREQLFKDEFELAYYAGKHFLFHPDMPTEYLNRREASLFKQLVGSDPLWANVKGDQGRIVLQGDFPVVLACNGKPRIHIDEDADAWLRRLVVVEFKTPAHEQHMGKLAEMIVKAESSGLLNWLLQGRNKLFKDKFQLKMTPEQKARAANLLMASQSPSAFVQSCLEKRKDSEITAVDLYAHYQEWCIMNGVRPFASQAFTQMSKEEIELKLGLRYRHDLAGEQGASRGWKNIGLVNRAETEKGNNASAESAFSI
jgi:P4 family phage/plasmid primase-like protien